MPKLESKQKVIDEIKDKLGKAKSVVLVDARGLTVEQDTSLRKTLREAGVDYKVYKNTMLSFAIKDTEFSKLDSLLFGPSALAISYGDPTAAAAAISKQFKAMPKLEFKGGIVEKTLYDAEGMKAIAEIPSRETLIAKLLGSWKAPVASFARLIAAIAEQKAGPAPAAEPAPAEAQ